MNFRHQGDVFRVKNAEDLAKNEEEKEKLKIASEQRHKAAFVASLRGNELLKAIMGRNAEMEEELAGILNSWRETSEQFRVLNQRFSQDLIRVGDEIYELGLQELRVREAEVKLFLECIEHARLSAQKKSIKCVSKKERHLN